MSFNQLNLDPSILKAITACGYTKLTPIQQRAIPEILAGRDVVASAQTGTGKTASFVLPALQRLAEEKNPHKPQILILTPTRELANQIIQAIGKYGKFLRFNMVSLIGGMSYRQQLRELARKVNIIVATPGRLLDHMENRRVDLSSVEMLVLDEADRMIDMGFIEDTIEIAKATPKARQTLLFSATMNRKLSHVVQELLKNPVHINLSQEKIAPPRIKQSLYKVDNPQHKSELLQHFLENETIFKGIIFTATKLGADKLAGLLKNQGLAAAALHGDLKQSQRTKTIEQFRRGKIQFLVATDVAARGLDISDMTHVFNYDIPRFSEDYVHRIGRTGRADQSGVAITFALPSENRHIQKIEKYIGNKLQLEVIEGLEPRVKESSRAPGTQKRKGKPKFGKFEHSDFRKSDRKPRERNRFEKSDNKSHRRDDDRSFEKKKRFAKSDRRDERSFDRRDDKSFKKSHHAKSERRDNDRSFEKSDRFGKDGAKKRFAKSDNRDKKPFKKSDRDDDRSFEKRFDKSTRRDGKPFEKRDRFEKDGSKKSFGKSEGRDNKSFGDKKRFGEGFKKKFKSRNSNRH